MCGRYGLTVEQEAIAAAFGVTTLLVDHVPRYNVAPTQNAPVVVRDGDDVRLVDMRWGLVPASGVEGRSGPLINARSESVASRPAFRDAWRAGRRAVVPATGFYEWAPTPPMDPLDRSTGRGRGSGRVPHWIHLDGERPFGFAGLWERSGPPSDPLDSFTILTTDPNEVVAPIHDRMPVILGAPSAWRAWLDPAVPMWELERMLAPHPPADMRVRRVSTFVNSARNEGPECVAPWDAAPIADDPVLDLFE